MGNNNLGHNLTYINFDAIHRENEGRDFSLTPALVPTGPCSQGKLAYAKNTWKVKIPAFKGVKETGDYCNIL
jgi:hypothetical protein